MSNFGQVAHEFERHRSFPPDVIEKIRETVCQQVSSRKGKLLDFGAGTGRLGRSFVSAGEEYVAVDRSFEMLQQFGRASRSMNSPSPCLVQAEGGQLPFPSGVFCGALLFHVFSASGQWRDLLAEVRRVLDSEGVLMLGQRLGPADGLDAQLREQLRIILADMDIQMPVRGMAKAEAQTWLESFARSHKQVVAASWGSDYSPRDFLRRHPTGAWFSALTPDAQRESLRRLTDWAVNRFRSLDATVVEEYRFELDVFQF